MSTPSVNGRKPHVMYLIDQLCQFGGGETALLLGLKHIPQERFHCSVVTLRDNPLPAFAQLGVPVHVLAFDRTYDWRAVQVARKLRDLIRAEQVDIVHTFFETANLWGASVVKLGGGPLLVSSRRDMGILRSPKHRIAYRVLRPLFDSVVTVSDAVRQSCIREEGLDPERVFTIYNGVDIDAVPSNNHADAFRASMGVTCQSPLITCVGNVRRVKGLDVLARAAAIVCREFSQAQFLIVGAFGDHEYLRQLLQLMRTLHVFDNFRFAGPLDNAYPAMQISDVFCLLSRSEGFSNALIEAMAVGLPCVATRVGGNGEALEDGYNGFLVPSENPDAAADRILRCLRDRELARSLGQEARRTVVKKFTAPLMGQNLADFYDRLLRTRKH